MPLEDIFAGISFADAKVPLAGGQAPVATPATQNAGNTGTPAPAQTTQGQQANPPLATGQQEPGKPPETQGAQPSNTQADKPLPFDQHPKWKSARAAEAAVEKMLQEHGLLNLDELATKLSEGLSLQKLIGTRDAKKLMEDADYATRVRQTWEEQQRAKKIEGETPEAKLQRLEQENAQLRQSHEDYKSSVEGKEKAQQVITNFNTEVDRVISSLEQAVPESELGLLKLVLGVDNPANMIDIEDQTAVRKMARDGITNFRTLVQKIKEDAIKSYIAGKTQQAVDTTQGAPASPGQGVERRPLPKDATTDQVFGSMKNQFIEVLMQGVEAANQ